MNIAVCVKQVPGHADIRLDEGRWTLARQGVPGRINPQDLEALEAAFQLRDTHGGCTTVLSMGPPQAEEALREALAMGADGAVLITDPALAGSDTLATSRALSRALIRFDPRPDLILCGSRSSDSDTGQVGPQIAEELGLPYAGYALEMEIKQDGLYVLRRLDRHLQRLRMSTPAVVSVLRSPRKPREIPLGAIREAFDSKKCQVLGLQDLGLRPQEVGLKGSATVVRGISESGSKRAGRLLILPPHLAVGTIMECLREHHLIT